MANPDYDKYQVLVRLCAEADLDDISIEPGKLHPGSFRVVLWRDKDDVCDRFSKTLEDALDKSIQWVQGYIFGREA